MNARLQELVECATAPAVAEVPRYRLASQVHVTRCEQYLVFLHVGRDTLTALPIAEAGALAGVVRHLPVSADSQVPAGPGNEADWVATLQALTEAGLVCEESGEIAPLVVPPAWPCRASGVVFPQQSPTSLRDVWRFVRAALTARCLLRFCPFERLVARIGERRAAHRHQRRDPVSCAALAARFWRLRPFVFAGERATFSEALTLLEFLALHRCYPDLVIAVSLNPFAKRFWLQEDDCLLLLPLELALAASPLLVA